MIFCLFANPLSLCSLPLVPSGRHASTTGPGGYTIRLQGRRLRKSRRFSSLVPKMTSDCLLHLPGDPRVPQNEPAASVPGLVDGQGDRNQFIRADPKGTIRCLT